MGQTRSACTLCFCRAPATGNRRGVQNVGLMQGAGRRQPESGYVTLYTFAAIPQVCGVCFLRCDSRDAGHALWPVRTRKSAAEIACVRAACKATTRAYALTFTQARAGMTEAEVARLMAVALLEVGGDSPWVIITSGTGNYDLASKLPSPTVASRAGDFVWIVCRNPGVRKRTRVISVWLELSVGPQPQVLDEQNRIERDHHDLCRCHRPGHQATGDVARLAGMKVS